MTDGAHGATILLVRSPDGLAVRKQVWLTWGHASPALLAALPLLLLISACSGSSGGASASLTPTPTVSATRTVGARLTPAAIGTSPIPAPASNATTTAVSTCRTGQLSLRLGPGGGAAGSTYAPIVFTNRDTRTCTLRGYPGVAFVAPSTGHQVGAAASRNPMQPVVTVPIAPGASASALLQITSAGNFPPASCLGTPVSGLRVYPPGNTSAVYIPFSTPSTACSTQVGQLSVTAVVTGATGQ